MKSNELRILFFFFFCSRHDSRITKTINGNICAISTALFYALKCIRRISNARYSHRSRLKERGRTSYDLSVELHLFISDDAHDRCAKSAEANTDIEIT